jgi:hypothetical protein
MQKPIKAGIQHSPSSQPLFTLLQPLRRLTNNPLSNPHPPPRILPLLLLHRLNNARKRSAGIPGPLARRKHHMFKPRPFIQALRIQELALQQFRLRIGLADIIKETNTLPPFPPGDIVCFEFLHEGAADDVVGFCGDAEAGESSVEAGEEGAIIRSVEVALADFVLDRVDVLVQRGRVVVGTELDDGRLDEVCGDEAPDLGDGGVVVEARVTVLFHPVEGVVVGVVVVDGRVFAVAETHVDRRYAGEVLEGCEVRAGAHGRDVAVPEVSDCLVGDGSVRRLHGVDWMLSV